MQSVKYDPLFHGLGGVVENKRWTRSQPDGEKTIMV